ncbi:MAG: LamB/YcsF family protein [Sphingobacteriia bacterium]|nr:LamB/YcsF family protein [Sphingobacteriia bacterium]
MYIDLNCDMGEGMITDEKIMPFISSANIACGFHAGNLETMKATTALALQHHVAIGAHPGFNDKANFGRTEIQLTAKEFYELISIQIIQLHKICVDAKTILHHVKPHGALYNMAAKDKQMAATIAQAVKDVNEELIVYGLCGSYLISEAKAVGLKTASEVFADRTYQDDGGLTSRKEKNALIENDDDAIEQVLQMIEYKTVKTISDKNISINAETICLHGDGKHAVDFAKKIRHTLKEKNIVIKTI